VQYVFLTYGAVILLIRLGGGRIPDRFGAAPIGTIATLLIAAGMALIAAHPSAVALYAGAVVFAVGIALQYPALLALTVCLRSRRSRCSSTWRRASEEPLSASSLRWGVTGPASRVERSAL